MRFWVAVTDNSWFHFLAQLQPDEVNFWQPSGKSRFRAIEPGAPFLFKLHSPHNYIVGGGFFVQQSLLPLSIAWDAFGHKNGAPDYGTFRRDILKYRKDTKRDPQLAASFWRSHSSCHRMPGSQFPRTGAPTSFRARHTIRGIPSEPRCGSASGLA